MSALLEGLAAEFALETDGHDPDLGRDEQEVGAWRANSPAFQSFDALVTDLWYSVAAGTIASSLRTSIEDVVQRALKEGQRRAKWLERRTAIIEEARASLTNELKSAGLTIAEANSRADEFAAPVDDELDATPLIAAAQRLGGRFTVIEELPGIVLDAEAIGKLMIDGWHLATEDVDVEDELFNAASREVHDDDEATVLAADLEIRWRALGAPRDLLLWARTQTDRPLVAAASLAELVEEIAPPTPSRRGAVRPSDSLDAAAKVLRAHLRGTGVKVRRCKGTLVLGDGKATLSAIEDDSYRVLVRGTTGDKSIVALATLDELRSEAGRRLCSLLSS